jgi:hypothetical protein
MLLPSKNVNLLFENKSDENEWKGFKKILFYFIIILLE